MIIALVSLIILVPIIYFLPLGLKVSGKMILIVISFCIASIGILAKNTFPLWQTGLLILLLVLLVAYILDKRLGKVIYLTNQEQSNKEWNKNEFLPSANNDEASNDELNIPNGIQDDIHLDELDKIDEISVINSEEADSAQKKEDEYLEEIIFDDEGLAPFSHSVDEKTEEPVNTDTIAEAEKIVEEVPLDKIDDDLSSLLEREEIEEFKKIDQESEDLVISNEEEHYMSEIEKLLEENDDLTDMSFDEINQPEGEEVGLDTASENLDAQLDGNELELESDDYEDPVHTIDDSLYEDLFKDDLVESMAEKEVAIAEAEINETNEEELQPEIAELEWQEDVTDSLVAVEEYNLNWEDDEIAPIKIEDKKDASEEPIDEITEEVLEIEENLLNEGTIEEEANPEKAQLNEELIEEILLPEETQLNEDIIEENPLSEKAQANDDNIEESLLPEEAPLNEDSIEEDLLPETDQLDDTLIEETMVPNGVQNNDDFIVEKIDLEEAPLVEGKIEEKILNGIDNLDLDTFEAASLNEDFNTDSEELIESLLFDKEEEVLDLPLDVLEVAADNELMVDEELEMDEMEEHTLPSKEEQTDIDFEEQDVLDIEDFNISPEKMEQSNAEEEIEAEASKYEQKTTLQEQIFHTMVSQIHLMRKQMRPAEYEKLIQDHMHPALPLQEYYTFASLLIEQYIRSHELEKLKVLLDELKERFKDYPIIQLEILYLYGQYYENTL